MEQVCYEQFTSELLLTVDVEVAMPIPALQDLSELEN